MEQLTLWSAERPARAFPGQDCGEACWMNAADWPGTLSGLFLELVRAGSSGRTCPELFRLPEDGISGHSSGRWMPAGIVSHGVSLTLSISACPSSAVGSSLSDIIETGDVPPRYFLSRKACSGLEKRDGKRGKYSLVSRETGRKLSTIQRLLCWRRQAHEGPRLGNGSD